MDNQSLSVKDKQSSYISTLDTAVKTKFKQHLQKILSSYAYTDDELFELKSECPVCSGRQRLVNFVECPCREAFSQLLYFKTLLNHTRNPQALPPEGVNKLPRIVLFRSTFSDESLKAFLFYAAIKQNLWRKGGLRKKFEKRTFDKISAYMVGRGEDRIDMPEALSYVYMDTFNPVSTQQEIFMDDVMTNFVETRYNQNKSVWIYQTIDSVNKLKFPQFYAKVEYLGRVITWGTGAIEVKSKPNRVHNKQIQ